MGPTEEVGPVKIGDMKEEETQDNETKCAARIIGNSRLTTVRVMDESGVGGANHVYQIRATDEDANEPSPPVCTTVVFQNGPIKEAGVNGCHNEDLLAIVVDRLQGFQSGKHGCRENAIALTKIESALLWLGKRTSDREKRGVEGTHEL